MLTVQPIGRRKVASPPVYEESEALDTLVQNLHEMPKPIPPVDTVVATTMPAFDASWKPAVYVEPPVATKPISYLSRSGKRAVSRNGSGAGSTRGRRGAASTRPRNNQKQQRSTLKSSASSPFLDQASVGFALPPRDPFNPPGIGASESSVASSSASSMKSRASMRLTSGPRKLGLYEPPLEPRQAAYESAFERAALRNAGRNRFNSSSSYLSNMTDEYDLDAASHASNVSFTDRSNAGLEAFMRSAPIRGNQKGEIGYLSREELKKDIEELVSSKHHVFNRWARHGNGHECSASKPYMEEYEFRDTVFGGPLSDYRHELYVHNEKYHHPIKRALNHPDRDQWGAVISALAHNWSPDADACWKAACGDFRYVVFDDAVRNAGYAMLLHDSDAAACYAMTHELASDDILGLDFFVSHDWVDESAPHRWQALCMLSDEFKGRYGRWPRFWVDKFCMKPPQDGEEEDDCEEVETFKYRTEVVAVVIAAARSFLLLQDPFAIGSFDPPQKPSINVTFEIYFATLYAPLKADPARELLGRTHNILVLKLFWGRTIPPPLDLLDGAASTAVRCSSGAVQFKIFSILLGLPGGLPEVQKVVAGVFKTIHAHEYHDWQQLRAASYKGDFAKMTALLDSGCYAHTLLPVGGDLPPLAIACMAYAKGGKVKKRAINALLDAGAAPLTGFNHVKFGELQADEKTFEVLDLLFEYGDFFPVIQLTRNALNKAGARIIVEYFYATKKLQSLCGLGNKPDGKPKTELIFPNRNLTESALIFVSVEQLLTRLDLSDNPNIQDNLSSLRPLNRLEHLNMTNCAGLVGSLSPLASLRSLLTLKLSGCTKLGGTLEPLEPLDQLRHVDLSGCENITGTINPLVNAFRMTHLILSRCHGISGPLSVMKAFESLKHLDVHYCYHISGSLRALAGCYGLEYLELGSTGVEGSLAPLATCKKLRHVNVKNTKIVGKVQTGAAVQQEERKPEVVESAATAPKKVPKKLTMRERRKLQKAGKDDFFEDINESDEDEKSEEEDVEEELNEELLVDENGALDPKVRNKLLDKSIKETYKTIPKIPIFADPGLMMRAPVHFDDDAPPSDR